MLGFTVLVGISLLGVEASPAASPALIQFHAHVLEMNGLGWRESLYSRLTPVARQGRASIWVADRELLKTLTGQAGRLLMSPKVVASPDALAGVVQVSSRKVASQLTRHADGPVDHAIAVAYTPDLEELREGYQFAFAGRKLDQGILARVVVDESRVIAVHQVKLSEVLSSRDSKAGGGTIRPQLDVPEVDRANIQGEWLIPNQSILVVSLGANTVDDGKGKAVVLERLLLIEADEVSARRGAAVEKRMEQAVSLTPPRPPASTVPMPVPQMPSRSLPQRLAADGTAVALPPLPEDPTPPTSLPNSSEPCATPQTRPLPEKKTKDEASTRVEHQLVETCEACSESTECAPPSPALGLSIKPIQFRIPLGDELEVVIRATLNPKKFPSIKSN